MAYPNPGYGYGGPMLGSGVAAGGSNPSLPPLNAGGPRLSNAGNDSTGGSMSAGAGGVSKEDVLRLIRTDPQFRNELRDVIAEFLQPEIEKLKEELLRELPPGSAQAVDRPKLDAQSIIQNEFPGSTMSPWVHQDTSGVVYGFPETIEIDVIKHNNMSYLCSVRDSVDIADVVFLVRIGKLYKSINPTSSLACVIVAREIAPRAKNLADRCKMKSIIV